MDQSMILFGRPDELVLLESSDGSVRRAPAGQNMPPYSIMVVYSGLSKPLVSTPFNQRTQECIAAARLLLAGESSAPAAPLLGHVPRKVFSRRGQLLPETLRRRATHFFTETARVAEAERVFRAGDVVSFGRLMTESGRSSIENYECGCPQLIKLYDLLRERNGVYGVRFSGTGFRGNCLALVDPAGAEGLAEQVLAEYRASFPREGENAQAFCCRLAEGARIL